MDKKTIRRKKIRLRIRKMVSGTASKPRLSVFRSNAEIYAQLIDDENRVTIASASSRSKDLSGVPGTKTEKSRRVGQALAQKSIALGVATCVFDRGGYLYHGRVRALAEGAREGGLQF